MSKKRKRRLAQIERGEQVLAEQPVHRIPLPSSKRNGGLRPMPKAQIRRSRGFPGG